MRMSRLGFRVYLERGYRDLGFRVEGLLGASVHGEF